MSIALVQPSVLLTSYAFTDVFGGCGMFMNETWNCPKNSRPQDIVNWILGAYGRTADKHLHNAVLHFHGKPGEIFIGESAPEVFQVGKQWIPAQYITIDFNNVDVFRGLKGKNIGTIWLHVCSAAGGWKGKYFCKKMAESSGCKVVAAEVEQERWWASLNVMFMPKGSIDDFEGQVYLFYPNGSWGRFDPNGGNWT